MPARHHTVPQFYLRAFADAAGQVLLVSRDDPQDTHRSAVHNAVAEAGFYRIETENLGREEDREGYDPESIEAALAGLEAVMAPGVGKLVEGRFDEFSREDWYRLIQFTAVQTARGHRWRHDFAAMATQVARTHYLENLDEERVRVWLADRGQPAEPDDVAAYIEELMSSRFPRLVPPQPVMVQESLKMALGDPDGEDGGLGRFLAEKKIDLILPETVPVLTSDEPVCWWSPGDGPVGYATAAVVWLPISPGLIVQFRDVGFDFAAHDLPDPADRANHDALAQFVNEQVAAQAERWIVHHPETTPLEGVELPPREFWGDELIDVIEEGDTRREIYVHRRLRPDS